jgi:hypothetical protein
MERRSFYGRFIFPLAIVVGIRIVSSLVYHASSGLPTGMLRDLLIGTAGPVTFVFLWFSGLIGPPFAYFRGARFFERIAIAFVNPIMWIIAVEAQVACQFKGVELLYFFFLPWTFGIVCVTCMEFALSELVCRTLHKRRRPWEVRVLHPGVLVLLVGGLTGTYFGLIKGQQWVYMVVHHYAAHVLN